MSDLEAKIRVTAENESSAGLAKVEADIQKLERTAQKTGQTLDAVKAQYEKQVQAALKAGASVDSLAGSFLGADGRLHSANGRLVKISEGMDKVSDSAKKAAAEVESASGRMNSALEKVNAVFGKIGTMLAGLGLAIGADALLQTADAMAVLNNQVRQVTASEAEYAEVKKDLLNISNRTKAEIEATTDLYVKSSRALKDYGYSQQQILTFTEATANAMTIGGVGAQQQAAALMQLSQALGSGVLQGDEFKSIADAAPILLDTIAEYMGKSRAEIKKLGSEGKLTAEVVFEAISGASEKFAEQAAKMPLTFGQSLTVLRNNWKTFADGMMNSTGVMSAVAAAVKFVAENLKTIIGGAAVVGIAALIQMFGGLNLAISGAAGAIGKLWAAMMANPLVAVAALIVGVLAATGELENALDAVGQIASDVFGLIATGYEGLGDLISAIYADITASADDSAAGQTDAFGGFFADTGDGFFGLLEKVGKVFDAFGAIIRTAIVWSIESFGDLWSAIKNGAVGAAGSAIGAIESLVNAAIDGINRVIALANQVPGISIGTIGAFKAPQIQGGNNPQVGRSWGDIHAAESARQQAGGLQNYFAGLRRNQGGGVASSAGSRGGASRGGAGGGGGGRKGRGGSGRQEDPVAKWAAELAADKLAYQEKELLQGTHEKWSLTRELEFWQAKLKLVDANSKAGLDIRRRIFDLQNKLHDEQARAEEQRIAAEVNAAKHQIALAEQQADQMLATERITQSQRLEMDLEFERQRYEIAYNALQERLTLAEQDPERNPEKEAQLKEQLLEIERQYQLKRNQIINGKENQDRKDNPSFMDALEDGKQNVWQHAQEQMGQAFAAMLNRTQSFRQAMGNMFRSIGQNFIQEVVTKPLMAQLRGALQQTAIWKMLFGTKETLETAATAKTVSLKTAETTTVVGKEAAKAAAGAASSQAGIPYVGPILAVAAMGAMMAAVMGLIGGGGGSSTSTTTTRIPSAAGGWDIPAGINPLTQLHEREMVLPAEHADTIRSMAGNSGGSSETIVINATGGDWIHKRDLVKLLREMKRDFRFA